MILAGDLGGTKTVLGEFEPSDGGLVSVRQREFPSRSYETFDQILKEFLEGRMEPPHAACFGVAGTVVHGQSHTTNLPWVLDERALGAKGGLLGAARVKLLNDLEATALGVLALPASDLAVLNPALAPGRKREGNVAVIAAGTGLGEAMLCWDGTAHHPIASEGGHADFAPRDETEVELWRYLRQTYGGHVSFERVVSGAGIRNIYNFLKSTGRAEEPAWLAEALQKGDPNPIISAHGLKGDVPICVETLSMFASAYGAEAGNAALRCVAVGGVFLAGGIAPKVLPALQCANFLESFRNKGRFSEFLKGIEISVSLNPRAALIGAAHYAARL